MSEPLTSENCFEYLKAVIDPEIYQNIVDLGLVYAVDVRADDVSHDDAHEPTVVDVTMTYTTPMCPLGPQIIADVEQVLRSKGASSVNVNVVFEPMWTPDLMTDDLKRELGIIEDDEPELEIDTPPVAPPLPPKKKGIFGRLFGR
jgi:metal-sulfur cluster biosynthetic enzyme